MLLVHSHMNSPSNSLFSTKKRTQELYEFTVNLLKTLKMKNSPFEVYTRIRPEPLDAATQTLLIPNEFYPLSLDLREPYSKQLRKFNFNGILPEDANNTDVYDSSVANLLTSLIEGSNSTCFAYGSTGSGKTHTMFGYIAHPSMYEPGVVLITLKELFSRISHKKVKISYLEIYNEQVQDLLKREKTRLGVVEDPVKGVMVPGLSEFEVRSLEEAFSLILQGNKGRSQAPTSVNEASSRSHAILSITLEQVLEGAVATSTMSLIDLAGSERATTAKNKGRRMKEGANINKSLLALGNCIKILSEGKKGQYVPYRDSKLTRLLKNSFGGNTKTVMIACVSPLPKEYESTLHTLTYAERATKITSLCKIALSDFKKECKFEGLIKKEINSLKAELLEAGICDEITYEERGAIEEITAAFIKNAEEYCEIKSSVSSVEGQRDSLLLSLANAERIQEKQLVQKHIDENSERKLELIGNLKRNAKKKEHLKISMLSLSHSYSSNQLNREVTIRTLKLEKLDLFTQNYEYQQQAIQSQQTIQDKDTLISQLRNEVNSLKKRVPLSSVQVTEKSVRVQSVAPRHKGTSEAISRKNTENRLSKDLHSHWHFPA